MNERKKKLFNTILKEHIKTGKPVSSNLLVDKYGFDLSPATIRNEMMELENEGYIFHPYTSAGRIPTERGYRFYIKNFLKERKLTLREKRILENVIKKNKKDYQNLIKSLAKTIASLSSQAVVVGFSPRDVYYTGLFNIFHQPEFNQLDLICHVSKIIDHLDEVMEKIFDEVDEEMRILLGRENPFGHQCSVVIGKYRLNRRRKGMLGILGPMRMSYERNIALLKYTQNLLEKV